MFQVSSKELGIKQGSSNGLEIKQYSEESVRDQKSFREQALINLKINQARFGEMNKPAVFHPPTFGEHHQRNPFGLNSMEM